MTEHKCGKCDKELGATHKGEFFFDSSKIKGKKAPYLGKYWTRSVGDITIICPCGHGTIIRAEGK